MIRTHLPIMSCALRFLLIIEALLATTHPLPAPILEIPESPSPTPPAAPTANLTGSSVNVVENFVKGLGANNADTQLQFYADEVSYYEMGRVTKHAIREDLEHDIRTWPSRIYSIHDTPKITQLSSGVLQAKFTMTYTLANSKRLRSGILQMTVRFRSAGQRWQVFEIQKKPIVAQKKS